MTMMMNSIINTISNTVLGLTNSNAMVNGLKRLFYIFFITANEVVPSSCMLYHVNHRYKKEKLYMFLL